MINFHIQRTQALSVYLQFSTLHLQRLAESPIDNNSPPKARIPKSQSPPPKPHQHPTTIAHQQPSPRAPPTTPSQPRPPFSNESPAPQRNTHSHTNHSHPAKSACAYDHLPSALLTPQENKMHQRVGKKRTHIPATMPRRRKLHTAPIRHLMIPIHHLRAGPRVRRRRRRDHAAVPRPRRR